jgi:5-methyltetrahydrofolate--homocysteine methyltransferase
MSTLLDTLRTGRVLLMDGAMATELWRSGLHLEDNSAAWNITHPDRVRAVHQAYLNAGARVLLSNTFMIYDGRTSAPVDAAWAAAFAVMPSGSQVIRVADVGPVAGPPTTREFNDLAALMPARAVFGEADALLLETCSSPRVRLAIRRLQAPPTCAILLSLTYLHDDTGNVVTFSGHSPEWFAERAEQYGVSALGVNCGRDLSISDCAAIVRRYRKVTDLPLFARPNAGTPKKVRGRWVYPLTSRKMAEALPELLDAGVSMVGGCCGTTPEHIAALKPIVDRWNARLRGSTGNPPLDPLQH